MIELGVEAKDVVTGFIGIVTARYSFLTGCDRYQLTPKAVKGEVKESSSFDENSIEVIGKGVSKHFTKKEKKDNISKRRTGGPMIYKSKNGY